MIIARDTNKMSRGVTQLAYVGDADVVVDSTVKRDVAIAGIAAGAALLGGGILRLAGALVLGYQVGKLRR